MTLTEYALIGFAGAIVGSVVFWMGYFAGKRAAMPKSAVYFDERRNEFLFFKRDSLGIRDRHGNP